MFAIPTKIFSSKTSPSRLNCPIFRYETLFFFALNEAKGEIVVVIGPPPEAPEASDEVLDAYLADALTRMSVKEASQAAAAELRVSRNRAYARALNIRGGS